MNGADIDRALADWVRADAAAPVPAQGLEQALAGVRRHEPRPAWRARPGSHWGWTSPRHVAGVGVRAWVAVALVALVVGGAIFVGSGGLEPTPPPSATLGKL